jgi:hypothetical protein
MLIRAGASRETGIRICYVMLGREYESTIIPADEDHLPYVEDLLRNIRVPVSAVRTYRGKELIDAIVVRMRGS